MKEITAFEDNLQRMIGINPDLALRIIDSIPAGLSITTDLSCKEIRHSRKAAEFLRIQPGSSLSHTASSNKPVKLFHNGKELTPAEMPIQRATWKGEEVKEQEIEFLWEDGVKKYALFNATPIYCDDGKILGAMATFEDITERKQAEEAYHALNSSLEARVAERTQALRESERKLATELKAAEHLQDLSTQLIQADKIEVLYEQILDTAMAILHADVASLQMFHSERGTNGELQLLGHRGFSSDAVKFWEWVNSGSQSTCGMALKTCQRAAVPDVRRCDFMAGSKEQEMCLENDILAGQTTPLLSRTGNLLGMISTHWRKPHELTDSELRSLDVLARQAADLIERKFAEESLAAAYEELRAADTRKDEFLGTLSHEIRNPLASIMLCLSLLDRFAPGGEQATSTRETMVRQVNQLSRLVDDLLDVTRITQNKIVLRKEQVELNELVRRTAADYQTMFQEKGVTLTIQPSLTALHVEADPVRLSQVVGNLLHNAVKFTETGGYTRVTIAKDELQQWAVISFADSGLGISCEMLPNLFKPFTQADTSLDRNGGGLGLGLVLVKGLTELHGGAVSAHSDGLMKGAIFTVRLPIIEASPHAGTDKPVSAMPYRKRRVLVVEDFRDVAETLRSLLVDEGHEVMVAYDGFEGIATAKEFGPEILLCDIGLPDMDGYQVARAFCNDEQLKDVFLVALTGYARPQDFQRAKEAGFNLQLAKPVDLDTLRNTLAQIK